MTDDSAHKAYEAQATPQHNARIVLPADEILGLGERCRLRKDAKPDESSAPEAASFNRDLIYHAASVSGSGEYRASEWLKQEGFSVFIPSRTVTVRSTSGRRIVRRPVFPCYTFVGRTDRQSWRDILRVPGVRSLVSFGEKPTELPHWMMKNLFAADELGVFDGPKHSFKVGQKVRLVGDLWDGMIGEVMRAPDSRRISVLLNALGKKHKFEVDVDLLSAA